MTENRLNITNISISDYNSGFSSSRAARSKELQAQFERMWLVDPDQFNPLRNCMERERLERTWLLLLRHISPNEKQAADIGCGSGHFSRRLRDAGAQVDAIDIAENALKRLKAEDDHGIHPKREAMPNTTLPDDGYDIVICTEVIAHLPRDEYRLFFAELARLVKPNGFVICSTPIDIDSDGGVDKLNELAQTEFDQLESVKSYHALALRLKRAWEAPLRCIEGWQNKGVKKRELAKRRGLAWLWYWTNTSPLFVWIWYLIEPLARPVRSLLKASQANLLRLEKICRFLSDEKGISHVIFIAKRRPLQMVDPDTIPIERPHKKEIWE